MSMFTTPPPPPPQIHTDTLPPNLSQSLWYDINFSIHNYLYVNSSQHFRENM